MAGAVTASPGVAAHRSASPDEARRVARDILSERRFQRSPVPRPLRGVLRWIGDRLRPVTEPIGRFFHDLWRNQSFALLLAAVLAALTVAIAIALLRRRERARVERAGGITGMGGATPQNPKALEREADAAEAAGRYEEALRLRFRAGLIRLARQGRVRAGEVEPSGEIARDLGSRHFDSLAGTFDAVVYGRRPAVAADLAEAKTEWPALLAESTR